MLRKPPSNGRVKASELEELLIQRLDLWTGRDWSQLVKDYERDCVIVQELKNRPKKGDLTKKDK